MLTDWLLWATVGWAAGVVVISAIIATSGGDRGR